MFGNHKWLTIFIFLFIVSIISGLINNTAVVAIFIPFVIDICQRYHISPSKLLLPLSYAAIFGGTLTLIGTSTNLLVNSIIETTPGKEHLAFGMFEFTKLGLIFLGVGTLYNIIVARWFIPSRAIVSSLTQKYHISKYVTEYKVHKNSSLIGSAFKHIKKELDYSIGIVKILRSGDSIKNPESAKILEGDVLIVNINADIQGTKTRHIHTNFEFDAGFHPETTQNVVFSRFAFANLALTHRNS